MSELRAARAKLRKLKAKKAQFELDLSEFRENLWKIGQELPKEKRKIVLAGGATYASSAAKYSAPEPGKDIPAVFFEDGYDYGPNHEQPRGRRRVYDLLALARNPRAGKMRPLYGKLLRQGYTHAVYIARAKKKGVFKPFRSLAEAKKYAHEDYRGLYRAAWGLGFTKIKKKPPAVFQKLASRRPDLRKASLKLSKFHYDPKTDTLTITNEAIPSGESFVAFMDEAASTAAMKTMNKRIAALMKRKYDL